MTLEGGSGSVRANADATDQHIAAKISATAPSRSIGVPSRFNERLTSTPTPPRPITSAKAKRTVSLCVRRKIVSDSAINAGIVAIMTAAIPEGIALFGPKQQSVVENEDQKRE